MCRATCGRVFVFSTARQDSCRCKEYAGWVGFPWRIVTRVWWHREIYTRKHTCSFSRVRGTTDPVFIPLCLVRPSIQTIPASRAGHPNRRCSHCFRSYNRVPLPAGKSWFVVCNPIAFGVPRPRMAFILTEDIFIIPRAFQEQLIIRIIAERTRHLCGAPIVITLRLGDRDDLATFTRMNSTNRLFLSGLSSA